MSTPALPLSPPLRVGVVEDDAPSRDTLVAMIGQQPDLALALALLATCRAEALVRLPMAPLECSWWTWACPTARA